MQHFEAHHKRRDNGIFVLPLPKKPNAKPLGESCSQAIDRFALYSRYVRTSTGAREIQQLSQFLGNKRCRRCTVKYCMSFYKGIVIWLLLGCSTSSTTC